jgi:DNA anti-recombination protein RmuC
MAEIRENFRTPLRILVPKLLKSRDDWKAKSHQGKAKLRQARVKIRDLSASRDMWRQRTEQLLTDKRQLQESLARTEQELEQARATLAEEKKSSRWGWRR